MLEIILGVISYYFIFLFIFLFINNKFKLAIIKIDKAEEDIDIYLTKKREFIR